jgi:hypothetical protein
MGRAYEGFTEQDPEFQAAYTTPLPVLSPEKQAEAERKYRELMKEQHKSGGRGGHRDEDGAFHGGETAPFCPDCSFVVAGGCVWLRPSNM